MCRMWVMSALLIAACTVRPNPSYCDDDSDCNIGTMCNLTTHRCVGVADAAVGDMVSLDAPQVARSVRELRDVNVPDGAPVELSGVVLTAVSPGAIWVQDLGGGVGTGVRVTGGPTAVVNTLGVGDMINIATAIKKISPISHEISVRQALGQILDITKVGTSVTPTITTLDIEALSALDAAQRDAELARWGGTLIDVRLVTAESDVDEGFHRFSIGPIDVSESLAPFPSEIVVGSCFTSITGVVAAGTRYALAPRSTSEVVLGSGCN